MKSLFFTGFGVFMALGVPRVQALDVVLTPSVDGITPEALAGFELAAQYWEGVLADDVVVNVTVGFNTLNPGVLGSAGSSTQGVLVQNYYAALGADVTTADDATAVLNLSPLVAGNLSFRTQVNSEAAVEADRLVVSVDNDGSGNNRTLNLNTANAKAVGLFTGVAGDEDASITFSDSFAWDFDNSDGIGAGLQDFVGVAIHEIGHSLGFVSGVDTVDLGVDQGVDLDPFRIYSGLDMFRYSADDGVLDLAVGVDSYFSLDGGVTSLGAFSTGRINGDGQQASHWKDNVQTGVQLGIMDPTARPAGEANEVTPLDLLAFDVIGWDVVEAVPEPSGLLLLLSGGVVLLGRRRRAGH